MQKQLITDQLIEELDKEINFFKKHIEAKTLSESTLALYGYKLSLLKEVKAKVQSLRQQEVQNVIDIHIELVREGIEREGGTKFTKEDEVIIRRDVNGYFTQTFEQKGGEKK